jgi:hypothetical protein
MTVKSTLNSAAVTDLIGDREIAQSERFVFLVEAKPGKAVFEGGDLESQTLLVDGVWDASGDDSVPGLLRKLRALDRVERDEKNGSKALASYTEQPAMYCDASGVVMTPAEIAEARGASWSETDTFVVEFEGGEKGLWPDEFPKQVLAAVGGLMALPGDLSERGRVVRYLEPESLVVLDEWSDADRLAEEEAQAERELAADAAAVEELEAHRTPQIGDRPISAMKAGDVVQFVKVCDEADASWLARALHWERGSKKPRRSVLNALLGQMGDLGLDTSEGE